MSKFSHLTVEVLKIIERKKQPNPDKVVIQCKVLESNNYAGEIINIEFTTMKRILKEKFEQSLKKNFKMVINVSHYHYKINNTDYIKYYCDSVEKSAPPPYL